MQKSAEYIESKTRFLTNEKISIYIYLTSNSSDNLPIYTYEI